MMNRMYVQMCRFVKKSLMTAHSSRRVSPAVRAWIAAAPPLGSALAW